MTGPRASTARRFVLSPTGAIRTRSRDLCASDYRCPREVATTWPMLQVLRAVVNPAVVIPKLDVAVNDFEVDQRTLRFIGSLDADCMHAVVLCCLDVE